jgi:hypothetical protein
MLKRQQGRHKPFDVASDTRRGRRECPAIDTNTQTSLIG